MKKYISKGQVEDAISSAMVKFEAEYMGRGPQEIKTYIIDDIIFVRLKGVLTVAEKNLSKEVEGKMLVKQTRVRLLENARKLLEVIVENITGSKVVSLHTDVSTNTGERVIIFTMSENISKRFK